MMVKVIYSLFLGIMLALFVGISVNTFYVPPQQPTVPEFIVGKEGPTTQQQVQQQAFDKKMDNFNKNTMGPYNRNVSIIALTAAVMFAAIGILLETKAGQLADGVLLGGVFTLIYSMGRGFASQNSKYSFIAVTIGLALALALGYNRFVRAESRARK